MITAGTILVAAWGTYRFLGIVMPDGRLSLNDVEKPAAFVVVAPTDIGEGREYEILKAGIGVPATGTVTHGADATGADCRGKDTNTNDSSAASHGNAARGDARNGMASTGEATTNPATNTNQFSTNDSRSRSGSATTGDAERGPAGRGSAGSGKDTFDPATPGLEAPGAAVLGEEGLGDERQGLPTHDPSRPEQCEWMHAVFRQKNIKCGAWECPTACPLSGQSAATTDTRWLTPPPPMNADERARVDRAFAHLRTLRRAREVASTPIVTTPIVPRHVGKPPWSHDPKGAIWSWATIGEKRGAQLIEWYEERAAIMEYMGKLSRGEAEYRAYGLLVENCRRHGVIR